MRNPSRLPEGGNLRYDSLGIPVPLGGTNPEKELIRLPKEVEQVARSANVLLRGMLPRPVAARLAVLNSIAGHNGRILGFLANIVAASSGEDGFARNQYLMALAQMLVPSAMPSWKQASSDGHRKLNSKDNRDAGNE